MSIARPKRSTVRKVHSAGVGPDTCFDDFLLDFDAKKSGEPAHKIWIVANESCSSIKQYMLVNEVLRKEISQFQKLSVGGFVADVFPGAVKKAKFLLG